MAMANRRKLALFGAGEIARRFKYLYEKKHGSASFERDFCCVIDSFSNDELFYSIPIKKPSEISMSELFVVVAVRGEIYHDICNELEKYHLVEIKDYIYYDCFEKKICLINANCHGVPVKAALHSSENFKQEWGIYPLNTIGTYREGTIEGVLEYADMYIHVNVSKKNILRERLSDQYCIEKLKDGCKIITLPNVFCYGGAGIFQTEEKINSADAGRSKIPLFWKDTLLDEIFESGHYEDAKVLLQEIESYEFDIDRLSEKFFQVMNEIKSRERKWDIKISNYIMENYKKIPLFNDLGHPSRELCIYICKELLKLLEIRDVDVETVAFRNPSLFELGQQSFVWLGIRRGLGIEYERKEVRTYSSDYYSLINYEEGNYSCMTREEFVREYIYTWYGKTLK